jgi:hypothetical protein
VYLSLCHKKSDRFKNEVLILLHQGNYVTRPSQDVTSRLEQESKVEAVENRSKHKKRSDHPRTNRPDDSADIKVELWWISSELINARW